MPYKNVSDATKKHPNLKEYSAKAQRGWVKSFNSAIESKPGDESYAFAVAYSVANKIDGKKSSSVGLSFLKDRRDKVNEVKIANKLAKELIIASTAGTSGKIRKAALGAKDKKVVDAFLDKKSMDSKKLYTDGKRLDGLWMGGNGIAEWKGNKIDMPDLGSKAADSVQKFIKKTAPKNWLK